MDQHRPGGAAHGGPQSQISVEGGAKVGLDSQIFDFMDFGRDQAQATGHPHHHFRKLLSASKKATKNLGVPSH